jgi:hypothetical protein
MLVQTFRFSPATELTSERPLYKMSNIAEVSRNRFPNGGNNEGDPWQGIAFNFSLKSNMVPADQCSSIANAPVYTASLFDLTRRAL